MKKQGSFTAYILIGIGLFFLLKQLDIPMLSSFYTWPALLIIIGISWLLHSLSMNDSQSLFGGIVILGLGVHFYGLNHLSFWIDHWAVYPLIIGIALIVRYLKTRRGLFSGLLLAGISLLMIITIQIPPSLEWIYFIINFLEKYWSIAIILFGIYLLKKKQ